MREITYRRLINSDLDTFIKLRINQLKEEGAEETFDLSPMLHSYYNKHMEYKTFISWVAIENGEIIGTSGISFVIKPPYYSNPTGKSGLLSSMYVKKEYRRMGIARKLLNKVVNEAKVYGCGVVQITASDMGVFLYTDFGFKKNNNFMEYKF